MLGTHECPGGCAERVTRRLFACRDCWYRLPESYRRAIQRHHRRNTRLRAIAVSEAHAWYAANSRPETDITTF